MSIPKEPRQLMINMMYIVLTALLALNVSTEILNAFRLIDDAIVGSNNALDEKADALMHDFESMYRNDSIKTGPYLKEAQRLREKTAEFYAYVGELKDLIIEESGGIKENGDLAGKKDVDVTTRLLVNQQRGEELQSKIDALREELLAFDRWDEGQLDEIDRSLSLSTEYDKVHAEELGKKDWSSYNFERVPVAAAVALLSKFQGDAKASEAQVLGKLYRMINVDSYKIDRLESRVIAPKSYILTGQQDFTADILVAGINETQETEVYIGEFRDAAKMYEADGSLKDKVGSFPLKEGFTKVEVENGVAKFSERPTSVGDVVRTGVIKVKTPTGDSYDYFPFELEYQSAQSNVVVSPDKMNVLYIGLDNPVSVSAAGFPADKLVTSVTGVTGAINGSGGNYTVNVRERGRAKINVSVKMEDGSVKSLGAMDFRVKDIPTPIVKVGDKLPGTIRKNTLIAYGALNASLEDFVFEVDFEIVSYSMQADMRGRDLQDGGEVLGPRYSTKMKNLMNLLRSGDRVYFDNVVVRYPGGKTKNMGTISYKIR